MAVEAFLSNLEVEGVDVARSSALMDSLSSDVFVQAPHKAIACLRPTSVEQVQKIWSASDVHGISIISRGAGLSYTGGILPSQKNTVLLDTRGLDAVEAVELVDRVVTVQAGATWQDLDKALAQTGMRAAIIPPISGSHSTIGGALAQGLPVGLEAVIGLDVVTPSGELIHIGPGHFGKDNLGAHRMMGADLLGVFLGTNGAFGTIVRAHLRLEYTPVTLAYRSFAARDMAEAANLITELSKIDGDIRLIGLPVRRERDIADLPWGQRISMGLKTLQAARGLRDAARRLLLLIKTALAPAQTQDASQFGACVHAIIEGANAERVGTHMDVIGQQQKARAISAALPAVMQSRPYALRGMLGPKGERWVPNHAIGAISQLPVYAGVVDAFFEEKAAVFEAHDIDVTWMMMAWPGKCALIEPMFMWPAPLLPIHDLAGSVAQGVKTEWTEAAKAATQCVADSRAHLTEAFDKAGSLHVQLGRTYPYLERLSPTLRGWLISLKNQIDPKGLSAPGVLGFEAEQDL